LESKLAKELGAGRTVEAYIKMIGEQKLMCSQETIDRALEIHTAVKHTEIGTAPTMRACGTLWLAARSTGERIHYKKWRPASNNTVVANAKRILFRFKDKGISFPNL